jgi:hypothetical protein
MIDNFDSLWLAPWRGIMATPKGIRKFAERNTNLRGDVVIAIKGTCRKVWCNYSKWKRRNHTRAGNDA